MANFLFVHQNFPAQFRHVAAALAREPGNRVVFLTAAERGTIPGVEKRLYQIPAAPNEPPSLHRRTTAAVREGEAALRAALELKAQGFSPDVVFGHSGWGSTLFIKEAFPDRPLLSYFEWFYSRRNAEALLGPSASLAPEELCDLRLRNTPILSDLAACEHGVTPTRWQHAQFPPEYAGKIEVLHDGIDTDFFRPAAGGATAGLEIVTYVARGMEPCRGFPEFMEALALLQRRRPGLRAIVVGADRVAYGSPLPQGQTYKQLMLSRLTLDESRIHFTGLLPLPAYLKVLQSSSVHVYLTRPFVLSWSVLEAMATGCVVVGSRTPPVEEVIRDGENGLLANLDDPAEIADRIVAALENPLAMANVRQQARETIRHGYALEQLLPRQTELLQRLANPRG